MNSCHVLTMCSLCRKVERKLTSEWAFQNAQYHSTSMSPFRNVLALLSFRLQALTFPLPTGLVQVCSTIICGRNVTDSFCRRQNPTPLSSHPSASAPSPHLPAGGARDFSLKPGETLNIKFGGSSIKKKSEGVKVGGLGAGTGFLLPPPPPPAPRR